MEQKTVHQRNDRGEVVQRYTVGPLLGKGGFAKCYQLRAEDGSLLAAKVIEKSSLAKPRAKQKLLNEIKLHKSLSHDNVVKFKRYFQDEDCFYILLQLCGRSTMKDLLKAKKRFSETDIHFYAVQLLLALQYVHEMRIIHRDLKLGNLFIAESSVLKLGDFGLAARVDSLDEKRKTICGTPNYIAPEVLEGKSGYSFEVDVWSFGVILFTLAFGHPPFESSQIKETYQKIKVGRYEFPPLPISLELSSVIKRILVRDHSARPTIPELLADQFFARRQLRSSTPVLYKRSREQDLAASRERDASKQPFQNILEEVNNKLASNSRQRIVTERLDSRNENLTPRNKSQLRTEYRQRRDSKFSALEAKTQPMQEPCFQSTASPLRGSLLKRPSDMPSVVKWIDYSSKYGLGYLLSNGHCGVYFNDCTKMVSSSLSHFYYMEKGKDARQESQTLHCAENTPTQLLKKYSLFQYFWEYLEQARGPGERGCGLSPYVKRWHRAKHAVLFRLSNKSVQVIFVDHTEIMIASESKVLWYKNKKGESARYALGEVCGSDNRELIKRCCPYQIPVHQGDFCGNDRRQVTGDAHPLNVVPFSLMAGDS